MNSRSELLVEIGRIVGTHGLRGDLKVRLHAADPEVMQAAQLLYLRLPEGEMLTVEPCRQTLHKGQVLLRLRGLESINQVEHLVGSLVKLPKNELPELVDDEYYWSQLKGFQVVDRQRGEIGFLQQMFTTAAHDVYVVKGGYGEVLIPAVGQFIEEINLEERRMLVDLPDGLIPQEQ